MSVSLTLKRVFYQNIDNTDSDSPVNPRCHQACYNTSPDGGILYMLHSNQLSLF